jgi:hypothetical protein
MIKAILAGFETAPFPKPDEIESITAANDAGLLQPRRNLVTATTWGDLDEGFVPRPGRQKNKPRCRPDADQQYKQEKQKQP